MMVLSYVWTVFLVLSISAAVFTGSGAALAEGVLAGAQSGINLALGMAGAVCLWSGVGALMERTGITRGLAVVLGPVLNRLFPEARQDADLSHALCGNVCANLLGLGNAATPMGIQAAKGLARGGTATDSLCRLVVLNTASIQLLPANVAAVRSALGHPSPFDILPAVWLSSLLSAGAGLTAAWLFGKIWKS